MSWILTNSGKVFDLLMPTGEMIEPADLAHALAHTCRFNGHVKHHYSVAQHSLLVCDLVEKPELKLQALLHDATEAYIGDMVRPLKELMPEYQYVERRIWLAVTERFGIPVELAAEVKHADMVALATEKRDLMPAHPVDWPCLEGITPHAARIAQWSPTEARQHYFHRLLELLATTHRARAD